MVIDELNLSSYDYSGIVSKLEEARTRELNNDLIQHKVQICEDIIEYSLELCNSTGTAVNGKDIWISRMYERNCIYLISAYELCRCGLINPANVILRSIFEVVDQIYLMRLTSTESDLFLKMDLQDQIPLNSRDSEKIQKKYRRFSPAKVREILYEKNTKRLDVKKFYEIISKRAHPSVKSAYSSFTTNPDMLDDTLLGIISLGIANLIAYWEAQFDVFTDYEVGKFDFILEKIHEDLDVMPFDIIPNHPDILSNVKFKDLESIENYFEARR
jgi:hypothetical protein